MTEEAIMILSGFLCLFPLTLYMVMCAEFPRNYDPDPWWVLVLKIWGCIITVPLFFMLFAIILQYVVGEQ